ncbi:MAG: orotidine-5'-phosphate decarboxylase [bacterium]
MSKDALPRDIKASERLIFALDVPNVQDAMALVGELTPTVKYFKVGLELFLSGGFDVIHQIGRAGGKVFLDLKMLDIPATVRNALKVIDTQHETIEFATIHVLNKGFGDILKNSEISERLKILVVTLLTSMDDQDLAETGAGKSVSETVDFLTGRALGLGCHGVIASGLEARSLREKHGEDFLIVTPGIRPSGTEVKNDDQKRVSTPREAILHGADYLVVGRPIRDAEHPLEAAEKIQQEIQSALDELKSPGNPGNNPRLSAGG